jgi:CIC family chloride channel protein
VTSGSVVSTIRIPRVSETQRLLLLSVLIGLVAGLIIVCFHVSIDLVAWAASDWARAPAARVVLPGVGALAAYLLIRHALPDARGSGIVRTKSALYVSNGYIPARAVPGKFAACTLSIGTGAPLGPEDPSLLMGAGVASTLGRVFQLTQRSRRLIAPVGAAAGIAAAFNTPITGVLFVIEEVVASWDAAVLGSIVLAAASAVVTTRWFLGDSPLFRVPELSTLVDPREAIVYVLLGVAGGLVATLYVRAIVVLRAWLGPRSRVPPVMAPFVAGCVVGFIGLWLPETLGAGYRGMDAALHSQYAWGYMAMLGLAKLAVAALAFGAGVPGGLFAPTLFVGVMLGGAVGGVASMAMPMHTSPLAAYILAGMGGVFAGVFRTPMTAVFMAFELSGTHVIIVPAMITATLGFLVARMFQRAALLTIVSEDEGAVLPSAQLQREEEPLRVEHAMGRDVPELFPLSSVADARMALDRAGAPVALVRLDGRGWAALDARWLPADDSPGTTTLLDHARLDRLPVAHPDEPLDTILRLLARHPIVPVVSRLNPQQRLGAVTLADVHRAYGLEAGNAVGPKDQGSEGPKVQGPEGPRVQVSEGPKV